MLFKNQLELPIMPVYKRKVDNNATKYVSIYYKRLKNATIGAQIINKWIFEEFRVNVSIKEIRTIQKENNFNTTNRIKTSKAYGRNLKVKFIKTDLVGRNFSRENVIGVDGTYFKISINKKPMRYLLMVGYDWNNQSISGYKFDITENAKSALDVFKVIEKYIDDNGYTNSIIQSGRGSAFASQIVFDYSNKSTSYVHSMSDSGFKHNAPTESLNGWIKQKFYKTYGQVFNSLDEFYRKFNEFVEILNKMKNYNIILKSKTNSQICKLVNLGYQILQSFLNI